MDKQAITEMLGRWGAGDRSVERALVEAVYPALRSIAQNQVLRQSGAFTLQATELANEAYAKLFHQQGAGWNDRTHFYAIAAMVIRRVVVDHARRRSSDKRGGGMPFVALEDLHDDQAPQIDDTVDWIALDAALDALAAFDPDCARVVELKFFSGLSVEKIAEVEGSSTATVVRRWRFARAWLAKHVDGS
jgi:RNA polymerase sigma factor (TIGR02999 family)